MSNVEWKVVQKKCMVSLPHSKVIWQFAILYHEDAHVPPRQPTRGPGSVVRSSSRVWGGVLAENGSQNASCWDVSNTGNPVCRPMFAEGAVLASLWKSKYTQPRGVFRFQLRVGVRVNFGHKGKCPGRDLSHGKEIGVPPLNISPTDEVWGSVLSSPVGPGQSPWFQCFPCVTECLSLRRFKHFRLCV